MKYAGVADTHAVIWYLYKDRRFSLHAKSFIDAAATKGESIGISSMSLIEIVYLVEKDRIPFDT